MMNHFKVTLTLFCIAFLCNTASAQDRLHIMRDDFPMGQVIESNAARTPNKAFGSNAKAPIKAIGSPKIPIVLVQFNDLKFTIEDTEEEVHENYNKYMNGTGIPGKPYRVSGGSWGSVSDYFIEQSDSLFNPEFTIIGPITLDKEYAYYGKDNGSIKDVNISAFYTEACKKAASDFAIDWETFDNDNNGTIDFVFFIYAGEGQNTQNADPNTIWPKEGSTTFSVKIDDSTKLIFGAYGCTNELYKKAQDGIGALCHELSHGLGLPDNYDTYQKAQGMDYLDLMDSGNYQLGGKQPCCYSAYERNFMGWRLLVEIPYNEAVTLTLNPIESKDGVGYKIVNPSNPDEYFVFENRQNINFDTYYGCKGNSDAKIFGTTHGLLITHIDFKVSVWESNAVNTNGNHQRITPVPADASFVSQRTITSNSTYTNWITSLQGDLYPKGGTEMSSYAVFTGGAIEMTVTDITENDDHTITLKLNGGEPDAIEQINIDQKHDSGLYYDLTGRIVTPGKAGIYIHNGKKIIVR